MRIRQPIAWSSVAALLAAAAFAQQPSSSTTQPRQNDAAGVRNNDNRMYALNNNDPKAALGRLEGVWKVEMRINPTQWHHAGSMHNGQGMNHDAMRSNSGSGMNSHQNTGTNPGGADANPSTGTPGTNQPNTDDRPGFQPQPNAENPNSTRPANQPGTQPGNQPGTTTRSQPTDPANNQTGSGGQPGNTSSGSNNAHRTGMTDQNRTTGTGMDHSAMSGGSVVQGYSEKRWIMGDDILQETFVVPDVGAELGRRGDMDPNSNPNQIDSGRDAAGNRTTGAQPANTGGGTPSLESYEAGRMLKSMSFLAFNEGTQRFDYVCMDSREGGIKHAEGTYDAASNRIEFNITDIMGGGHDMGHSGSNATRAYDPTNPRANMNTPTSTPTNSNGTSGTTGTTSTGQPGANNSSRTTDPTRPTDSGTASTGMGQSGQRQEWSNSQAMKDNDFRVVVEILSPDQHRVTMYRDAGSESWEERQRFSNLEGTTTTPATTTNRPGSTTQPATNSTPAGSTPAGSTPRSTTGNQPATSPGSTPGNTTSNPTGTTPGANQPRTGATEPGSLAWNNSFDSQYGVIVWQATYTRVNGAEASRFRQNLQRADQLMQTAEVETDR